MLNVVGQSMTVLPLICSLASEILAKTSRWEEDKIDEEGLVP